MFALLFSLLQAVPGMTSQAAAEPLVVAQSPVATIETASLELARLMSPKDLMVQAELREFDQHFRNSMLGEKSAAEFDGDYPGMLDALVVAMRPFIAEEADGSVDKLHLRISKLIEDRLTLVEIQELSSFYRSSAGRNVVKSMSQSSDAKAAYQQIAENPDAQVTRAQVDAQIRRAAEQAHEQLSDADRSALLEFMKRPIFARLAGLQPLIKSTIVEVRNRTDPETEARVTEALTAAMSAHMAKIDAERSRK